ncbi:MAG: M56 family metallopeptidase [Acidobacteriota bacterium]
MIELGWLESCFQEVVTMSWRWTPIFLAAWLLALALPAPKDRRRLWVVVLLALPAAPLLQALAPSWSLSTEGAVPGRVWDEAPSTLAPPASPGVITSVSTSTSTPAEKPFGVAHLWMLGVAALLSREVLIRLGAVAAGRISSGAPERIRAEAADAARMLGVKRLDIRLGDVRVPVLCGVLRPRVVLPTAAAGWPSDRLRASLLHELAHQRHGDPWLDVGARFVGAFFFFHPGVWLARRALAREMEQVADAAAVDAGRGAGLDGPTYGRILLDIARHARAGLAPGLAMARPGGLETRLRSLLRGPSSTPGWRLAGVGAILAALALSAAGLSSEANRWLRSDAGAWGLQCGGAAECAEIQATAQRLLAVTGREGALLVQKVETGEVVAYAARGVDPVPLASPASVAKLPLATAWWETGLGDRRIPCPKRWSTEDGVSVGARRDRGELMAPHEMLIHSCSTAAGVMALEVEEKAGAEELASSLRKYGFMPGVKTPWLPSFVPAPREGAGLEWEARRPILAALLGRVPTTPFHVASFVQAIGNDGVRLTMGRPGGGSAQGERLMASETSARLLRAMEAVVTEGTGRRGGEALRDSPWQLLGKTGTWAREDGEYNGWFAGLAADDSGQPKFVVVVFLRQGGMGGGPATLLAAEVTRALGTS